MSNIKKPYVIVLGNEKGGTGKSTAAMHVMVYLLRLDFKVGCIDVDARQGTLTRYIENRIRYNQTHEERLPTPVSKALQKANFDDVKQNEQDEKARFDEAMAELSDCDFIVIDTPGNDTFFSRVAHSYADTIITPLNDSFIDLDMLVRLHSNDPNNLRPSVYSEMIWEQKKNRLMRDKQPIDWIVMRNRLTNLYAKNKEEMHKILTALSKRVGYRLVAGFSERVIFRELFVQGLTLLDLQEVGIPLSMSHIAARQEIRSVLDMLQLPHLQKKLETAG
ncbi:MAG: AAA family ATPase [Candidatus Paracaedibacteraceae bacterium]|nr:AAA family ATPase [Candidatus Paracaedibacteraceae bacterium]